MHQRDNGGHGEFHLEAQRHIKQDAAHGQQHPQATLVTQLFANLRTDELDTLERDLAAILVLDNFSNPAAQIGIVAGQTNQHIG